MRWDLDFPRFMLFAGATCAPALPALAQDQAPPAAAVADRNDQEIVVVADPAQRTSIDRDTYMVRDTAEARTSNAIEILSRIPAVTVQPDGDIRLLGTTGVTVLIDGRPPPDGVNVLRDLRGAQIEKIEVVTNPGVQFSASGTGGVINIVTRRTYRGGLRGSVNAAVTRYGGFEIGLSPTWTRGDWSLSGGLGWYRSESVGDQTHARRGLDPASALLDTDEDEHRRSRFDSRYGLGQIGYHPDPKRTMTLQGSPFGGNGHSSGRSEIVRLADPDAPLDQRSVGDFSYHGYRGSLEYREEGRRQGELLTTSLQQVRYTSDSRSEIATDFGADSGLFRFDSGNSYLSRGFKVDYVRPLHGRQRLLIGGLASDTRVVNLLSQSGDLPLGGNPFPPMSRIDGSVVETAAYANYQFPLLGGTILAGVRIEGRNYDFADASLGEGPSDAHAFPSVHLERPVAPWLTADLSYSRRIRWPGISDLSPALRFSDATTAQVGNPALRPEMTDSYEAKAQARVARQTISLTAFSRRTGDLFSAFNSLDDNGVLVTRRINLGTRLDRGVSLAVQGPIASGLSYSLNANLADRRTRQGLEAPIGPSAAYDATLQVDYRDGTDGRRGADHVTLTASHSGPTDYGLTRYSDYSLFNLSWSHAWTDRVSAVLSVNDILGPTAFRSVSTSANVVSRDTSRSGGPGVKLALTYSLGPLGQPPAPQGGPPPIPGPGG